MIVDLLRNDLGRIARPGTVEWSKVFEPERFETVWQLTSTVVCRAHARHGSRRRSSARSSPPDR